MASETLKKALEISEYIVQAKRRIHRQPELGMQEFETTGFVKSELEKAGIEVVSFEGGPGVLGLVKGEKAGKGSIVALRADMDALPVQETADVPDKSTVPGVMHACGHDAHTACLLGAAKLLASAKKEFSGTVKLIFQPAEETLGGARYMIGQGVLDNPKVDYILGLHGHSGYDVGQIALRPGNYMASSDFFTVRMTGKSGHGAYPHRVESDPVLAASNAVMAVQSIVTRQIDALDSVVISVCEIHGGTAKNIIPERVEFSGSVRCQNMQTRNTVEKRITDVVTGVAASYKCTAEVDYSYGVPPLVNDPKVAETVLRSAEKIVGEANVDLINIPAMGSEDFSRYLEIVPTGVFARLGIRVPGRPVPVFHNGDFVFADEALPFGTALFVQFVLDING